MEIKPIVDQYGIWLRYRRRKEISEIRKDFMSKLSKIWPKLRGLKITFPPLLSFFNDNFWCNTAIQPKSGAWFLSILEKTHFSHRIHFQTKKVWFIGKKKQKIKFFQYFSKFILTSCLWLQFFQICGNNFQNWVALSFGKVLKI